MGKLLRSARSGARGAVRGVDWMTGGALSSATSGLRRGLGLTVGVGIVALVVFFLALNSAPVWWTAGFGVLLFVIVGQLSGRFSGPKRAFHAMSDAFKHPLVSAPFLALAAGLPVLQQRAVLDWIGDLSPEVASVLAPRPLSALVVVGAWALTPMGIGLTWKRTRAAKERLTAEFAGRLAVVFGVPLSVWEAQAGVAIERTPGGEVITVNPVPAAAHAALGSGAAATRLASVLPTHEIAPMSSVDGGIIIQPASEATRSERAALAHSRGMITGITELGDTPLRPQAQEWTLAHDVIPSAWPHVAELATTAGFTLVEWAPYAHRAVVARLSQEVRALRDRYAHGLRASAPHEIELEVTSTAERPVERVRIVRGAELLGIGAEKRGPAARQLVRSLTPGGSNGWVIEDDGHSRVTFTWGEPRRLPETVDGASLLPSKLGEPWHSLPIGVDSGGGVVSADLLAGPHVALAGGTGAGKTVAFRALILNALARGFDVLIVDPQKRAAGLRGIEPWTRGIFTTSVEEAAMVLESVYAEVRRRVDLIDSKLAENWLDLDPGSVRPLLVLVDEYESLTEVDPKPLGLAPGDPALVEWQDDAVAKGRIRSAVGKMAREARSAGVHLVIATQTPSADALGSSVRAQLGTTLMMIPPAKPPKRETLGLLFSSAEDIETAQQEISDLNDGRSRGLGLAYVDGGGVVGLRVGFISPEDMAAYAESLGLPKRDRWPVTAPQTPGTPWKHPATPTTPEVVSLGEFAFTLDEEPEVPSLPTSPPEASSAFTLDSPVDAPPTPLVPAPPPLI